MTDSAILGAKRAAIAEPIPREVRRFHHNVIFLSPIVVYVHALEVLAGVHALEILAGVHALEVLPLHLALAATLMSFPSVFPLSLHKASGHALFGMEGRR